MLKKFKPLLVLISLIWLGYFISLILPIFKTYGIVPRTFSGLKGILFSNFIHQDFHHLISNSMAFITLSCMLIIGYPKKYTKLTVSIALISGGLIWGLAREANHIGVSGVIYGFASFLIFTGWYQRSLKAIVLALIVLIGYGSLIYGLSPFQENISWEGHLFGGIAGFIMARSSTNKKTNQL